MHTKTYTNICHIKYAFAYAPQSLDMSDAIGDAGLVPWRHATFSKQAIVWWRHDTETLFASLTLCVFCIFLFSFYFILFYIFWSTSGSLHKQSMMRNFDVVLVVNLTKQLDKQSQFPIIRDTITSLSPWKMLHSDPNGRDHVHVP